MINYQQKGEVLPFTAPSGGVVSGQPYLIDSIIVIATHDAAEGLTFEGLVTGVVEVTKTEAQAWAEGAKVYLDVSPREFTTTSAGNTLAGVAARAAANPSTVGYVRLDGVAR